MLISPCAGPLLVTRDRILASRSVLVLVEEILCGRSFRAPPPPVKIVLSLRRMTFPCGAGSLSFDDMFVTRLAELALRAGGSGVRLTRLPRRNILLRYAVGG